MKTAVLFGASGLIGSHLFELLLESSIYSKIKIFSRKSLNVHHPKVEEHIINFDNLEKYSNKINGDDCFYSIGTTRKLTPNKIDYINIEFHLPVKIAKISKNNNIKSFVYISSGGANAKSKNLYLQNKGKAEKEIMSLSFNFLAIIQPSILLGYRKENRTGERIAKLIFKNLSFLFIGKLRPFRAIHAKKVAKAIMIIIQKRIQDVIFESDKLEDLNKKII